MECNDSHLPATTRQGRHGHESGPRFPKTHEALEAGFFPMAMLWQNGQRRRDPDWIPFARHWARPQIVAAAAAGHRLSRT